MIRIPMPNIDGAANDTTLCDGEMYDALTQYRQGTADAADADETPTIRAPRAEPFSVEKIEEIVNEIEADPSKFAVRFLKMLSHNDQMANYLQALPQREEFDVLVHAVAALGVRVDDAERHVSNLSARVGP